MDEVNPIIDERSLESFLDLLTDLLFTEWLKECADVASDLVKEKYGACDGD